jgi:hypothetical protein
VPDRFLLSRTLIELDDSRKQIRKHKKYETYQRMLSISDVAISIMGLIQFGGLLRGVYHERGAKARNDVVKNNRMQINPYKLPIDYFYGILISSSSLGYDKLLGSFAHRVFLSIG